MGQPERKSTGFYAKLVLVASAMAIIAGLFSDFQKMFDLTCKWIPSCNASPYRFEGEISEYKDVAKFISKLEKVAGKVAFFDLRITSPTYESNDSLHEEENGELNGQEQGSEALSFCADLFTEAPSMMQVEQEGVNGKTEVVQVISKAVSQFTTLCGKEVPDHQSTFAPGGSTVFVINGYFLISPPAHRGGTIWGIKFNSVDPHKAISLIKQQ